MQLLKEYLPFALLLPILACSKADNTNNNSAPGSDSTFNGSYLEISYNGKTYKEKDVMVGGNHLVTITATSSSFLLDNGNTTTRITATNFDPNGIYGLGATQLRTNLYAYGNGTGSFPMYVVGGVASIIYQANPATTYRDSTGTMNITHNGSDYLEGTFTANLCNSGFIYPATGSFKVFR